MGIGDVCVCVISRYLFVVKCKNVLKLNESQVRAANGGFLLISIQFLV